MSNAPRRSKAEIARIRKRRKLTVAGVILAFIALIALTVAAFVLCRVETITVKGDLFADDSALWENA